MKPRFKIGTVPHHWRASHGGSINWYWTVINTQTKDLVELCRTRREAKELRDTLEKEWKDV